MTKKQEKILDVALELFAENGFKNTTTSLIAERAGVSEGLIFRHFINKEGLLAEILKMGSCLREKNLKDIVEGGTDEDILRKIISAPFDIISKKGTMSIFYKFLIRFQIERNFEKGVFWNNKNTNKLEDKVVEILTRLQYSNPKQEGKLIFSLYKSIFFDKIMGISVTKEELEDLRMYMLKKYNLV